MPQATSGLLGALQAFQARRLREQERADRLAREAAEQAARERQLAIAQQQADTARSSAQFEQQATLAEVLGERPGVVVPDPSVLGDFAGALIGEGNTIQERPRERQTFNVSGIGVVEVGPDGAFTLVEAPANLDLVTGTPEGGGPEQQFAFNPRTGEMTPTGIGAPRGSGLDIALVNAASRMRQIEAQGQIRRQLAEAQQAHEALMQQARLGSAEAIAQARLSAQRIAMLQDQLRIAGGLEADFPRGLFGGGGVPEGLQEDLAELDRLLRADAPGVISGTPATPAPAPDTRERAQSLLDRINALEGQ